MQGLIETGGSVAPAEVRMSGNKKYIPTLAAFMVPAMVSGLVAAFVYVDAKPSSAPEIDLAVRAEMVRYAAQKVPTITIDGTNIARTAIEHPPLDDLSLAATPQIDVATR